jgi:hypothetical protein
MPNINPAFNWRKLFSLKIIRYAGFIIGPILILCFLIITFLPDPFINTFLKERITKAITEAYSFDSIHLGRMHYNFWKNKIGCDSITLKTSDYTISASSFSVTGIGFMKIIRQSNFTFTTLANSELNAQNMELYLPQSQRLLRLGSLHISIPDSELVTDSLKYSPLLEDEHFFMKSQFRQTRFRIHFPQMQITGLDCLSLLEGNAIIARYIHINGASADVLVNMDKSYDISSPKPKMPNELFASMRQKVKIDSLKITDGKLKYSERFAAGLNPAVISINKVNISAAAIVNHTQQTDTTIIHSDGLFMNTGRMKLFMAIPLESKDFSLRYSGSLGSMDVSELNSFIEPSENQHVNSGSLQSAKFNINVNAGHASGKLRLEYRDLEISVIDKKTGSEKGIFNQISSFFAKIFVIHKSNVPDEKGAIKIGETRYNRNPDDYFFQFVWFAIRNGIADIVGFPPR